MNTQEQQAILTIALLAAFADGSKADTEREAIRRMADSLGHEAGGAGMAQLYQDVLLKRVSHAIGGAGLGRPRPQTACLRNGRVRVRCRRPPVAS